MNKNSKEKVGIKILCSSKVELKDNLKNILWGIEEEEIPFIVEFCEENNARILGYRGARESKLHVGIGISTDEITLYHEKLILDKPLFVFNIDSEKNILRALGANSARLIKGIPFIIPNKIGGEKW